MSREGRRQPSAGAPEPASGCLSAKHPPAGGRAGAARGQHSAFVVATDTEIMSLFSLEVAGKKLLPLTPFFNTFKIMKC